MLFFILLNTKPQLAECANGVPIPLESDFMIENFGKNISNLRRKKNVSQEELAEYVGVGKAAISKIELGTSFPTFSNLDKIARYFNATATQLFGSELEIQLEIGHDNIDEYFKKATVILEARNAIPEILSFQEKINNMIRSEKIE